MATNPNRPQFQDTIASTWGQSVADHVIRRYASTAARDADLTGISAADLAGQYVAINPTPGDVSLWRHDGIRWNAQPIIKSGQNTPGTNASSQLSVTFTTPFPAGYVVHVLVQPAKFATALFSDGASAGVSGFSTTIMLPSGAGVGNGIPTPINWHAIGWPAGSAPQIAQRNGGRPATEAEAEALAAELAARDVDPEIESSTAIELDDEIESAS
jgi:hypothetical protein